MSCFGRPWGGILLIDVCHKYMYILVGEIYFLSMYFVNLFLSNFLQADDNGSIRSSTAMSFHEDLQEGEDITSSKR